MPAKSAFGATYAEDQLLTALGPPDGEGIQLPLARTGSGDSGVLPGWGEASALRVQLDVTAVSGTTPTLNVVIEDTLDGSTFNTIATFTQKTAVSREVVNVTLPFSDRLRVRWTIGGTSPSIVFGVVAASNSPQG